MRWTFRIIVFNIKGRQAGENKKRNERNWYISRAIYQPIPMLRYTYWERASETERERGQ